MYILVGLIFIDYYLFRQAESRIETGDWEIFHNLGVCYTYLKEWEQAKQLLRLEFYFLFFSCHFVSLRIV